MKTLPILVALCLIAAAAHAQERTASGQLATEASWQALQNRIDATNGNVNLLRADMDAIKRCAKKKMLYSPTVPEADADGCINSGANYTGPLITGGKTGEDCMDAGGRPTNIGNGYICQMAAGLLTIPSNSGINGSYVNGGFTNTNKICPVGWQQYQQWSRTVANSCGGISSCATGSHKFQNRAQEMCSYYTSSKGSSDRQAGGVATATTCPAHFFSMGCI